MNRQTSCAEEFQIIYVDTLPTRGCSITLLKCGLHIVTSSQRVQYQKRRKRVTSKRKLTTLPQPGDQA